MDYRGKYKIFDHKLIKTYPLASRESRVSIEDFLLPEEVKIAPIRFESKELEEVARAILGARRKGKPVIWAVGAHLVKNGLSPLLIDLMKRGLVTLVAGNGAVSIHDFEIALIGRTSENVPRQLPEGKFGLSYETGKYLNDALIEGAKSGLGYGESVGKMILGQLLPQKIEFPHQDFSILAQGAKLGIPVTIHVTIGADVIHEHPNFDGAAVGVTSGRDFAIFVQEVTKLAGGGVVLNVGSAITGPEVLLKACSMAANIGQAPRGIICACFDIKPFSSKDITDETSVGYYSRDFKSVVVRIPEAFAGKGYYIQADQRKTIPALYSLLTR